MTSLNIDVLILLVRSRPQLWDRGNRLHSNRHVVDKCWREIAAEMKADENKIRKKWKYLRDQFTVEFGKIPPSASEQEVMTYEPRWRHYRPLKFLEEVVTPRVSTKNPRRDEDSSDSMDTSAPNSPDHTNKHKRYREKSSVDEEHLHFFKSLLPHVRTIPKHLQLSFRNRVQQVVEEFAYQDKSGPSEPNFISCVPDREAKLEPPEPVDESQDNQDDDDEDGYLVTWRSFS